MDHNKLKSFQIPSETINKQKYHKLSIVFFVVIILQSYLVPLITLASGADYSKYVAYSYFYIISSYSIIVLCVIIFSNELEVFQDYFSLGLIVLTCFLRVGLGGDNELFYRGILMFLGFILIFHIIINRRSMKMPALKSVFIGLLWSFSTTLVLGLIRLLLDPKISVLPSNLVSYIFDAFLYQLSFVTIEEAYFRGILFGLLVINGFKEVSALFIQGVLFCGIHYMKMADPILFFILLPLFTLSVTLIIKKYKMLYLPIMVHTFNNVFGALLVALVRHS